MDHRRKIDVPLKACTAMAAEVAGASDLTGILDLVLVKITVKTMKPVHRRNHKEHMRPQSDKMITDLKRQEKNNNKRLNEGNVLLLLWM